MDPNDVWCSFYVTVLPKTHSEYALETHVTSSCGLYLYQIFCPGILCTFRRSAPISSHYSRCKSHRRQQGHYLYCKVTWPQESRVRLVCKPILRSRWKRGETLWDPRAAMMSAIQSRSIAWFAAPCLTPFLSPTISDMCVADRTLGISITFCRRTEIIRKIGYELNRCDFCRRI